MQVLVIGYVWPEPQSSAAGSRMMQLLDLLLEFECSVTFGTTATPTPYCEDLKTKGIRIEEIELNSPTFDSFLKHLSPAIVIYDRFMMEEQFGWRVNIHCPEAITILDTEDLHFLRNYREKKFKNPELPASALKTSDLAKREIASIYRCDLSLIISEVELEFLKEEFKIPQDLLFYLPFLLNKIPSEEKNFTPHFKERKDFISIGNFKHAPNVDAVFYLKKEIWPLIHKQLPDANLLIYGAYPTSQINALNDPRTNFLVKGRIEDSGGAVRNARVSLAALRYGAGLKGKLIEAMQNFTPTVTTPVGAEGINDKLPWNGKIASNPTDFASAAVELYQSQSFWERSVRNGINIINKRFLKENFQNNFISKVEQLQNGLQDHRLQNFTGSMMRHHYLKSTYYLSKYIEIKNSREKG